jgi:hypothetical protein
MHECCSRSCATKYAQMKGHLQAPVRMPSGTGRIKYHRIIFVGLCVFFISMCIIFYVCNMY